MTKLLQRLGYRRKTTRGRKLTEMLDPGVEPALQGLLSEEIAGDPIREFASAKSASASTSLPISKAFPETGKVSRRLASRGFHSLRGNLSAFRPDRFG
ncbi:hypothetical protein [Bradyrhizobium sp. CCBAU 11386]|uniref:hypothetical protein n=1 Tax=Bradyrhizobium sp. CCBAU 11386 TaxID=1630837 RepID=UPI00230322E8|nr:hypothetical protein [Bradyrhizobium sp. CCBAU 11386]